MDAVVRALRAQPEVIDLWLRGLAPMPERKMLPLADLLLEKLNQQEKK